MNRNQIPYYQNNVPQSQNFQNQAGIPMQYQQPQNMYQPQNDTHFQDQNQYMQMQRGIYNPAPNNFNNYFTNQEIRMQEQNYGSMQQNKNSIPQQQQNYMNTSTNNRMNAYNTYNDQYMSSANLSTQPKIQDQMYPNVNMGRQMPSNQNTYSKQNYSDSVVVLDHSGQKYHDKFNERSSNSRDSHGKQGNTNSSEKYSGNNHTNMRGQTQNTKQFQSDLVPRQQSADTLNDDIIYTKQENIDPPVNNRGVTYTGNENKKVKMNDENDVPKAEKDAAPWISKDTLNISNSLVKLHNEIIEFVYFMKPKKEEIQRKEESIKRLKNLIEAELPGSTVKPFGSYVTKLFLPDSDVDLVIVNEQLSAKKLMGKIAKILYKNRDHYDNINPIKNAKVPIIKLVDSTNNVNVDMSFNKLDGINQLKEVERALRIYPEMKYIIILFKMFLRQRDLGETYSGGIGSFLLFCMVLAFLREFRREYMEKNKIESLKEVLLSEYLLKILYFYGNFDCSKNMILMKDGGLITEKENGDTSFCLISPQDDKHDIGNAAFKIKDIFGMFKNRYNFLTNYNYKPNESVLKYFINPCKEKFAV